MSENNFEKLQKEVCDLDKPVAPLKKLCAPCIPNNSFIEPDWRYVEVGEPYFNEKKCEYQITVTVNEYGDTFSALEFQSKRGAQKSFDSHESLLRSFIHPAIVLMLEEYGKIVADQVICASFPTGQVFGSPDEIIAENDSFEGIFVKLSQQPIDKNKKRCMEIAVPDDVANIDTENPISFSEIVTRAATHGYQNPFALELYTKVSDYFIDPLNGSLLKVHVTIPAYIFEQVPESPTSQELQAEAERTVGTVELKMDELFGQITRLKTGLRTFARYQSYFYQSQDGFLRFKESKKDYYASSYPEKISNFYSDLKDLAKKNNVNIRSNIPSFKRLNADTLTIEFKKGPDGNPYVIKKIFASKQNCPDVVFKKGIKSFKKEYSKKPTLMNYISKIREIDISLTARKTPAWMDFLVKYTYPALTVDYGLLNNQSVEDSMGKCVTENTADFAGDLKDYILNEVLSFAEAMSYQYSTGQGCSDLFDISNEPEIKEFEKQTGSAKYNKKNEIKEDAGIALSKEIDTLIEEQQNLETFIPILIQETTEKKNRVAVLEGIDMSLFSGEEKRGFREEKKKLKEDISKSEEVLRNMERDLKKKTRQLDKLLEEEEEVNQDNNISRKSSRILRKNAAKRARAEGRKNHPYVKKARKIASDKMKNQDGLFSSLVDWKEYGDSGKLTFKKMKKKAKDEEQTKTLIGRLSVCTAKEITTKAIRCLFSGVTQERAFDKIFRSAMQAMDIDVFGFFINSLPFETQEELRERIQEEFGNIPLPWEENYVSGTKNQSAYFSYLSSSGNNERDRKIDQEKKNIEEAKNNLVSLERKLIQAQQQKAETELLMVQLEFEKKNAEYAKEKAQEKFDIASSWGDVSGPEKEALFEAQADLTSVLAQIAGIVSPDIEGIEEKIESQKKELSDLEANMTSDISDFKNMSDEEKNEFIQQQKKGQGSFGKAFGNIQKEIVDAYIEYLFDLLNYEEIGEYLSQFPGGRIVFDTFEDIFKCSTKGLFNPPIDSFLSSITLDLCGPERNIGISIPEQLKEIEFPSLGKAFFITKLKNLFIEKVENAITQVIVSMLLKLFEILDSAACKGLNLLAQGALGNGLDDAFAEAFCQNADPDDLDDIKKNAFGNALGRGAVPDEAYDCLFAAVNGTMSKQEIVNLLTNTPKNMDDEIAEKFALLVNSRCPELSDLLGSVSDVKDAFGSISKFIPQDLRDFMREQATILPESPIYDAICLTQDELDKWNQDRMDILMDEGLNEDLAQEMVNKANERVLDNLGTVADMLQKGPQGMLEEALDAILKQKDPACANDPAAILFEDEEFANEKQQLMNSFFSSIENKFKDDLIGERSALISNIMVDTEGHRLKKHENRASSPLFLPNYVDSEEHFDYRKENSNIITRSIMDKDRMRGMFPNTVGLRLLNQIKNSDFKYESMEKVQLRMGFKDYDENPTFRARVKLSILDDKNMVEVSELDEQGSKTKAAKVSTPKKQDINELKKLKDILAASAEISPSDLKNSYVHRIFETYNNKILNFVKTSIITTPAGAIPIGFKFGADNQKKLTFNDLLYVNPEANPNDDSTWEYTYEDEEGVLGKSATENPRVHFLDPSIHGGSYTRPKIYIEPATYNGWLGMIKTFIPEMQSCDEAEDEGFLNITEIAKRAKEVEGNLPVDERLNAAMECRLELPYDRQLLPSNHGLLEGMVLATIRVFATEFSIRCLPIFGSINFNKNNLDDIFENFLSQQIEKDMVDNDSYFHYLKSYSYNLLFIEQCVQVVQRQIIDGLMEETEEIKAAFKELNKVQNEYEKFTILGENSEQTFDDIKTGAAILANGKYWKEYNNRTGLQIALQLRSGFKLNLAQKIGAIHRSRKHAKVIMGALLRKELEEISKKMNFNLRPRPHVYDIKKYLLSKHGIMLGSETRSGETSVEQEVIEGSSTVPYGTIPDCASEDLNPSISNLLTEERRDFMFLEKYVRVVDSEGLSRVMTISEFEKEISKDKYDKERKISDYFGNAYIDEKDDMQGTIGVKFGVRIVFAGDKKQFKNCGINPEQERVGMLKPIYINDDTVLEMCYVPVCSYEHDLIDKPLKDIEFDKENMGEDLKCYIDRLVMEENFETLFEYIFKTNMFVSLFAIYSYHSFIWSIGKDEEEVPKENRSSLKEGWQFKILDDTKRILLKQFRSLYMSQDDEENKTRRKNRDANLNFLKNLIPQAYLGLGDSVKFLQRIRIVDTRPFDKDGNECLNEFQKLFKG